MDVKECNEIEQKDENIKNENKSDNKYEKVENDKNIELETNDVEIKEEKIENKSEEECTTNKEKKEKEENVMNLFLNYIQKNKNDPDMLKKMLNMMNSQINNNNDNKSNINNTDVKKEEACENDINLSTLNISNSNKDKSELQTNKDTIQTDLTNQSNNNLSQNNITIKINDSEMKEEKDANKSDKINDEIKKMQIDNFNNIKSQDKTIKTDEINNSNISNKEILEQLINTYGNNKKIEENNSITNKYDINNKSLSNELNKNNISVNNSFNENTTFFPNNDKYVNNNNDNIANNLSNNGNNGTIKKKYNELVEDNDEYVIEDVEEKKGLEEEAINLIENLNILKDGRNNINTINNNSMNKVDNDQNDFKLYHSKNSWEELKIDNELIQILTFLKFFSPSKIQAYALPIILNSNKNLIAQSQNGSGKTLTFVIAMLSKINRNSPTLQAMCICPTRELSQQNFDVIGGFTKYLKVKIFLAVPLCDRYNKNIGVQIYVGTPGKTLDFLKRKYIDTNNMKLFVLDEADDLIDIKNNMSSQVENIKRFLPRNCQILLFSATYNNHVRNFADKFAPHATKISVRQEDLTLKCVKQYYLITENEEQKYYYLSELYCSMTISQCVIFVNSKKSAYNLYKFMTDNNHNVTLICADSVISRFTKNQIQKTNVLVMDPKTRDSLMSDFKKGISKVLICTDLLSRGIDVPSISLVINFDLPYIYQGRIEDSSNSFVNQKVNMETYIHRIGRTGRFGSKGMAINFISKQQLHHINQIEKFYQCVISDLEFDSELMKTSLTKLKN